MAYPTNLLIYTDFSAIDVSKNYSVGQISPHFESCSVVEMNIQITVLVVNMAYSDRRDQADDHS